MATSSPASFLLASSHRPPAAGASAIGNADPALPMSVSLRLRRNPAAGALPAPGALSATPVRGRVHLSREAFATTYGATASDIAAVKSFAAAHALTVVTAESGRRMVTLSGTAAQMSQAFGVSLQTYHNGQEGYIGYEGGVTLPAELSGIVTSVHGLDTRRLIYPLSHKVQGTDGGALGTGALSPAQVARLYNFPTSSAAGQTIGILEFGGGYQPSDMATFFKNANLPLPSITVVPVGATNSYGGGTNEDGEVTLDIQIAASAGVGAKIAVYFAPWGEQGIINNITTAIHDTTNNPSVISVSWGWPESNWGNTIPAMAEAFAEAAAMGVTVFVASGDSGAGSPVETLYPGSDPSITSCGGTTVSTSPFTQTAWAGSGGGVSNAFGPQSYQSWANVPASQNPAGHTGRGVPDIAGNASNASGYNIYMGGGYSVWYGTSMVAPLYAGLTATLNAILGAKLGFLNNNLYALQGPYAFEDITTGSNGAYSARPGWDPVTGLGSINGGNFLTALLGVGLPPAVTVYNNEIFMAWKGIEFDDGIYTTRYNGSSWTPQSKVASYGTSAGVSLAVFDNTLYMAWKGEGNSQGIWYASYNGTSWSAQQEIGGVATSTGPRLAVFGGKLYMAWKGMEDDQRLWFSSFNGTSWAPQQMISGVASSVGPALAVFNGKLYAAWKGEYGDPGQYYASFDGTSWTTQAPIANTGTSEGPSLAVYDNQLYAIWMGEYGSNTVWYASFNGTSWTPQKQIPGILSSVGPGITSFGNTLFAAWKGMNGDQRIWYSAFNGTSWTSQQIVPGVATSPDLAAAE